MNINFSKYPDGLVPAIVQDVNTKAVLMLGFMNQEAVDATVAQQKVTFFSRSKSRLWTKGEESGNFLNYIGMDVDCDNDTLLIQANPVGPVCHNGTGTCWGAENAISNTHFLNSLEAVIAERKTAAPDSSYVASLFEKGINKIAQKVGEEAVELVIEALMQNDDLFKGEAADLIFHLLVLLEDRGIDLSEIIAVLQSRHAAK